MAKRVYKPRRGYRRKGRSRYSIRGRLNRNRRRLTRGKRFNRVHRTIGGFPNAKTVALRYVQSFSLNPGSGVVAGQVFRMNNLFDPDYSGGGHQPMFYDNYAALYQKYRVNSATITFVALDTYVNNVFATNNTAGTTTSDTQYYAGNERAVRMFILRDDKTTDLPTGLSTLIEEGSTNLTWRYAPQSTGGRMNKISMIGYPKSLFKCPYNDAGLSSDMAAGPSKECYFIVGVEGFGNDNADAMNYEVIITYNVTFFDLKKSQPIN